MALMSSLKSRLLGRPRANEMASAPVAPPGPVDGYFQTRAMSIDKPTPTPTRLINLALDAIRAVANNEIQLGDLMNRPNMQEWITIWPGEHYLLLAALMQKLQPRRVIEIGTDTGMSSLVMRRFMPAGGKLTTFDIRPWKTVEEAVFTDADFADGSLEQRLVDLSHPAEFEKHRAMLEETDFFFIDGPKDNVFEYKLLDLFKTLHFKTQPILLYDDTKLPSMLKFWYDLKLPKLDLTGFAHWSGTGLVEWQTT
jgi:predicted O-methyltransferase YrrM